MEAMDCHERWRCSQGNGLIQMVGEEEGEERESRRQEDEGNGRVKEKRRNAKVGFLKEGGAVRAAA